MGVTNQIIQEGGEGMAVVADCTSYDAVCKMRDEVISKYGKVDVMINAGIHDALPNGFKKMSPETWYRNMDIKIKALATSSTSPPLVAQSHWAWASSAMATSLARLPLPYSLAASVLRTRPRASVLTSSPSAMPPDPS